MNQQQIDKLDELMNLALDNAIANAKNGTSYQYHRDNPAMPTYWGHEFADEESPPKSQDVPGNDFSGQAKSPPFPKEEEDLPPNKDIHPAQQKEVPVVEKKIQEVPATPPPLPVSRIPTQHEEEKKENLEYDTVFRDVEKSATRWSIEESERKGLVAEDREKLKSNIVQTAKEDAQDAIDLLRIGTDIRDVTKILSSEAAELAVKNSPDLAETFQSEIGQIQQEYGKEYVSSSFQNKFSLFEGIGILMQDILDGELKKTSLPPRLRSLCEFQMNYLVPVYNLVANKKISRRETKIPMAPENLETNEKATEDFPLAGTVEGSLKRQKEGTFSSCIDDLDNISGHDLIKNRAEEKAHFRGNDKGLRGKELENYKVHNVRRELTLSQQALEKLNQGASPDDILKEFATLDALHIFNEQPHRLSAFTQELAKAAKISEKQPLVSDNINNQELAHQAGELVSEILQGKWGEDVREKFPAIHTLCFNNKQFMEGVMEMKYPGLRKKIRETYVQDREAHREKEDKLISYIMGDEGIKEEELKKFLSNDPEEQEKWKTINRTRDAVKILKRKFETLGDYSLSSHMGGLEMLRVFAKGMNADNTWDLDEEALDLFKDVGMRIMLRSRDKDAHFFRNFALSFMHTYIQFVDAVAHPKFEIPLEIPFETLFGKKRERRSPKRESQEFREIRLNDKGIRKMSGMLSEMTEFGRGHRTDQSLLSMYTGGLNVAGSALGNTLPYLIPYAGVGIAGGAIFNDTYNRKLYHEVENPLADAFISTVWQVGAEKISFGKMLKFSRFNRMLDRVPVGKLKQKAPWLAKMEGSPYGRGLIEFSAGLGEELVLEDFINETGNVLTRELLREIGVDVEREKYAPLEHLLERLASPEQVIGTALFVGGILGSSSFAVKRQAEAFSLDIRQIELLGISKEHAREISGISAPRERLDKVREYYQSDVMANVEEAMERIKTSGRTFHAQELTNEREFQATITWSLESAGISKVEAVPGTDIFMVTFVSGTDTGNSASQGAGKNQVNSHVRLVTGWELDEIVQQNNAQFVPKTLEMENKKEEISMTPEGVSFYIRDAKPTHPKAPLKSIGLGLRRITQAPKCLERQETPFDSVAEEMSLEDYREIWYLQRRKEFPDKKSRTVELPEGYVELNHDFFMKVGNLKENENLLIHFKAASRVRELLFNSVLISANTVSQGNSDLEIYHRYAWIDLGDKHTSDIRNVKLTIRRVPLSRKRSADELVDLEVMDKVESGDFYQEPLALAGQNAQVQTRTPSRPGLANLSRFHGGNYDLFAEGVKKEDKNYKDWLEKQKKEDPDFVEGQVFSHHREDLTSLLVHVHREEQEGNKPNLEARKKGDDYIRAVTDGFRNRADKSESIE